MADSVRHQSKDQSSEGSPGCGPRPSPLADGALKPRDHNAPGTSTYLPAVEELVAIGAAIEANCEPCFICHYQEARNLGVSREDMLSAVKTAQMVEEAPAKKILKLAGDLLTDDLKDLPVAEGCNG